MTSKWVACGYWKIAPISPKILEIFNDSYENQWVLNAESGGEQWYAACSNTFSDRTGATIKDFCPQSKLMLLGVRKGTSM